MEKYVVEVYDVSENEDEKVTREFLGFWKGAEDKQSVVEKGTAIQLLYLSKSSTDFTMRRVKGVEIGLVRVGADPRNCLEFKIIPESQSEHIGGDIIEENP